MFPTIGRGGLPLFLSLSVFSVYLFLSRVVGHFHSLSPSFPLSSLESICLPAWLTA